MSFDLPQLPNGWVYKSLEECARKQSISYGVVQPGTALNEGIPIIRVNNFKDGRIELSDLMKISPEIESKYSRTRLVGGEVLITLVGSVGQVAVVPKTVAGFNVARAVAVIHPEESISPNWIAICLRSPLSQHLLVSRANTTVQTTINLKDLRALPLPLPPLWERSQIESFISALDDRIALLRETNTTLEAIAQALFKSWFVDFDPVHANAGTQAPSLPAEIQALFPSRLVESPQGLIPEGWEVCTIADVTETLGGATPNTKNEEFWNPPEVSWTSPKDLSGLNSPVFLETERKISKLGLSKISSGLLPIGTLLMSSRAPIGYLAMAQVPLAINQGYIAMPPGGKLPPLFMLYWCRQNMEVIENRANGSTFMEISKKAFRPIEIILPPRTVVDAFMATGETLFDRLVENEKQIRSLSDLRDTLLPRLISGQLRLPEAEAALAEVG